MRYIFWSFHNYKQISTESCGKITFLQKKKINMQCCRAYASERKPGEYFSPSTFKSGFQRVFGIFRRGFQRVPHSKEFQSVQKGFQRVSKHFKRVSKCFKRVSKGFQKGFRRVSKRFQRVSKGFLQGFKVFQKGFKVFQKGFQRVSKGFQSVSKGFPKGFKPSETRFPKGFRATSNPLENAFVDKTCFRMEGHIYSCFSVPFSLHNSRSPIRTFLCSPLALQPKCMVLLSHTVPVRASEEWSLSWFINQSISNSSY